MQVAGPSTGPAHVAPTAFSLARLKLELILESAFHECELARSGAGENLKSFAHLIYSRHEGIVEKRVKETRV